MNKEFLDSRQEKLEEYLSSLNRFTELESLLKKHFELK
jgi:hypothetical protein